MNENLELLEYIYKDCNIATYTLTKLLEELNGRDNKIKIVVEDNLKEYEKFLKDSKKLLEKNDTKPKNLTTMAKIESSMGVKKEVIHDNSDSSIADMLIKGLTMGSIDINKKIDNYKGRVDKKILELAKDFVKFQEKGVEKLKPYL